MHSKTGKDEIEVPKKRYISPEKRQQIIDELRLVQQYIMKYQKLINLLDNASNQSSKFRTKNCVEINEVGHGKYNKNTQIKLKKTLLKSSLCDCSDAYVLVEGNIKVNDTAAAQRAANNTNKK